jgi:hypothetical protein
VVEQSSDDDLFDEEEIRVDDGTIKEDETNLTATEIFDQCVHELCGKAFV